jgi:hypothetical protein
MPSPERGGYQPERERKEPPFHQAARFTEERLAGRVYKQAEQTIYENDCDLSTYRLQVDRAWHVAVLGEVPPQALAGQLQTILAAGEPTTLPREVLTLLMERRRQAGKVAPWVERHYRPKNRE